MLDLFFGAAKHRLLLGHLPLTDDFIREGWASLASADDHQCHYETEVSEHLLAVSGFRAPARPTSARQTAQPGSLAAAGRPAARRAGA